MVPTTTAAAGSKTMKQKTRIFETKKQKAKRKKQNHPNRSPESHSNIQCRSCDMIGITYATKGIALCGFCKQPLKIDGENNDNITRFIL